ncbi:DUF4169 family protein [Thalassovita aquimarina]|uniref:DUF4169 family protein n=1 Tax=Thalassovita aquimarina TaxID=2785917 RepID=A0ABS5HLL3_9RHOB|nr:DUF4169 family protein [Thalassovita aquimarina]MBR9649706.1 DUF4169 family protein [Thalassovita aquimarina]
MAAKVINLRTVRKQKARTEREDRVAQETKAKAGVTRPQRELDKARAEKAARDLEGKKRE